MLLKLEGLCLQRGKQTVLHELCMRLQRGQFVALIGPNGAGKTSLLRVISGQLKQARGSCEIDELDASSAPVDYRRKFGLALAPDELPGDLSPRQLLQLVAASRGFDVLPAETLELADRFGLARWLDCRLATCSLGARQKTGVLTALVGLPPLLLLDEPFNGLDPLSALELKQCLRGWADAGRCGVLLATHNLELAERWLDGAVLLLGGSIAAQWDAEALQALQADGGLELAMAQRMRLSLKPDS
jgi:ABC-2 type transport system ATP-binding protein